MDMNGPLHQDRLGIIMDWVAGRADPDVEREVIEASRRDSDMVNDVNWATKLHRSATELPLIDPPPLLRQRLRQQFSRWVNAQDLPEPSVLGLSLTLVFDSRRDRLAVGMRGAGSDGGTLHLVWRTEIAELVMQARRQDSGLVQLHGQVLLAHSTSSPVFEATVYGPGTTVRATDGDIQGRFHTLVPDTVERLVVTNGELAMSASIDLVFR